MTSLKGATSLLKNKDESRVNFCRQRFKYFQCRCEEELDEENHDLIDQHHWGDDDDMDNGSENASYNDDTSASGDNDIHNTGQDDGETQRNLQDDESSGGDDGDVDQVGVREEHDDTQVAGESEGVDDMNNNVAEKQIDTKDNENDESNKDKENKEVDGEDEGKEVENQGVDGDTMRTEEVPGG